jgi:Tfp pilus assembly protein PilN
MKERLYLDYRRAPAYTWVGKILLGLGLLTLVATGVFYQRLLSTAASQQSRLALPGSFAQTIPEQSSPDSHQDDANLQAATIVTQLDLPWETFFQSLEASSGNDVAVLAIESQASPPTAKITAEAHDFATVTRFVERLQSLGFFTHVELLTHHVRAKDPQHPVRFEVGALWGTTR